MSEETSDGPSWDVPAIIKLISDHSQTKSDLKYCVGILTEIAIENPHNTFLMSTRERKEVKAIARRIIQEADNA